MRFYVAKTDCSAMNSYGKSMWIWRSFYNRNARHFSKQQTLFDAPLICVHFLHLFYVAHLSIHKNHLFAFSLFIVDFFHQIRSLGRMLWMNRVHSVLSSRKTNLFNIFFRFNHLIAKLAAICFLSRVHSQANNVKQSQIKTEQCKKK